MCMRSRDWAEMLVVDDGRVMVFEWGRPYLNWVILIENGWRARQARRLRPLRSVEILTADDRL